MEIKTKFDFSHRVWPIHRGEKEEITKCSLCSGKGTFIYKDTIISCPDCYGMGFKKYRQPTQWFVLDNSFIIGKIGIEQYNPNNKRFSKERSWIYYMAESSGTMWDENQLFHSKIEAQKECDKRNTVKTE